MTASRSPPKRKEVTAPCPSWTLDWFKWTALFRSTHRVKPHTWTSTWDNWDPNQPLQHKLGETHTLYHRAKSVITDKGDLDQELHHLDKVQSQCNYLSSFLESVQKRHQHSLVNPNNQPYAVRPLSHSFTPMACWRG